MKNMDWLFKTPVAHRGFHGGGIAENSMSAYKAAIEKGYTIEIDVHPTTDRKVLVFHDFTLKRICGEEISTSSLSSEDLKKHKLGGTEDTIPTLHELLSLIDGKVGLLIEIKKEINNRAYKNIAPMVYEIIKDYKGNVAVQSFAPGVINWFKANAPDIPRGLLATAYSELNLPKLLTRAMRAMNRLIGHRIIRKINPDFLAYNVLSLPSPTVEKIHKSGLPLIIWTVRNEEQFKLATALADNIIFEKTDIHGYIPKGLPISETT